MSLPENTVQKYIFSELLNVVSKIQIYSQGNSNPDEIEFRLCHQKRIFLSQFGQRFFTTFFLR